MDAWRAQLADSARNPKLKQQLHGRESELLPCFAAHYQRLSRLPRRMRRSLQRQWKRSLAGVALLMALGALPAQAANITVDGTTCTLVDAITAANNDTATGGCPAGSGSDVLSLQTDVSLTTDPYDLVGPTGLPVIESTITIQGNNHTIARSSAPMTPNFRILAVAYSGNLTLQQTTVSGGRADGTANGGGVYNYGFLTVTDSTISGNSTLGDASGGGVFNRGTLTLTDSTISGNSTSNDFTDGGGVANRGTLTLTDTTISGNSAGFRGGGIFSQTTLSGVTTRIRNSTVSGNSAFFQGGGVFNFTGLTMIENSTITNNTTPAGNGSSGVASVGDIYTRTEVGASIISGNANLDVDFVYPGGGGINSFVSTGFNVIGDGNATAAFMAAGDQIIGMANPGLGPLADNGGPTRTHAVQASSPALDAVTLGCPPPNQDQRGQTRPVDGNGDSTKACDAGSVELQADTMPTPDERCNGRVVTLMGTQGNDRNLRGTNGPDVIQGLGGNDRLFGLGGNDMLCGGSGRDSLVGGDGQDQLFGNNGNDSLKGGNGPDALNGGAKSDTCRGGAGRDSATACEARSSIP